MAVDGELQRCVRAEYARLVAVVAVVTGSHELAEEAVQEAFARAWERTQRGEMFEHLEGWVVTVALNYARSGRRRRQSERRAVQRLAARSTTAAPLDPPDVSLVVRSALDGLPGRQRDAVVLYYLLDVDVATTARLLGVSTGTIKSALSRARARLSELLREPELES